MTARVPSPCIQICQLDPAGRVCVGCFRSIEEIALWTSMSDAERQETLARCASRKAGIRTI